MSLHRRLIARPKKIPVAVCYSYRLDEVVSPGLFESVRRALWRLCWRVIFPSEEFRFGGWAPGTLAPWLVRLSYCCAGLTRFFLSWCSVCFAAACPQT